jgi:hypothetical protein
MRLRVVAALLLLTLSSASTRAAGWSRTASAHFEIYTTGSEKGARDALLYFEQVRGFFDRFLSLPPSTRLATRVILFSTAAEFAPYRVSATAAAYYQPARDRDYIVLSDFNGDSDPVIVHEYAHLAIERSGATYPPWLSEGLAEFFSTLEPARGRVLLGRAPLGRVAALAAHQMLPLDRLLAVTQDSPEYLADHSGVFYAESWAFTHMLIAGEGYQPHVDQFLARVAHGTPPIAALTSTFRTTIPELERELRRYVTRGYYRQLAVPGSLDAAAPPTASGPVDAFDARLVLANLLAVSRGRESQARAAFDALARERPNDAPLAVSRGMFEVLTGHDAAARTLLERALAAGTRDPRALGELARLVEDSDPNRASDLVNTALSIAPDDPLNRIRRAGNLVARHRGEDALAEAARIDPVPADLRFIYFQVIANAHALLGQFDEAVAAAKNVVLAAHSAGERRFADDLVEKVRRPADATDLGIGRLTHVTCDGSVVVLDIAAGASVLRLVIDDPAKVFVPGGGSVDLSCGPQDSPVRYGYAKGGAPPGITGRLRFLEIKGSAAQCSVRD